VLRNQLDIGGNCPPGMRSLPGIPARLLRLGAFPECKRVEQRKAPPVGGADSKLLGLVHPLFRLRRSIPPTPSRPVPSKTNVPGSGTTMFVSPLEMLEEPLKKPLPVLMVT